jgi:hypothetical protein
MTPIKQPNRWSCLPTTLAILLDTEVATIIDIIGHDGSTIIFPEKEDPHRRRSFHIQEIVMAAYQLGYALIQMEAEATILSVSGDVHPLGNYDLITCLYNGSVGILCGLGRNGNRHAAVWNGHVVIDPMGPNTYPISDFTIEAYFMLYKIKS